jgi:hypothetical protein
MLEGMAVDDLETVHTARGDGFAFVPMCVHGTT